MTTNKIDGSPSLHEFFVRYFDDSLSDSEHDELNKLLQSSDQARELFNEMVFQAQSIADVDAQPNPILPSTLGVSIEQLKAGTWFRLSTMGVIALAASILLAGLLRWRPHSESITAVVANLATINGVAGPEGDVTAGTTVYTRGAGSSARLVYPDGTEVLLDNESRLVVEGEQSKVLRLQSGHITANVAPQPAGHPMLVRTKQAVVEVLGTELTVDAEVKSTSLSVQEGVVRLKRLSDGQAVEIHAGQFAVADGSASRKLGTQDSPQVPDEFVLSFDKDLPSGWRVGKRMASKPPSREAYVRAEPVEGQPRGTHYQIYTQNAYYEGLPGLFRIHDDTHLHLTYRMAKPGWFQVFVGVRPNSSVSAKRANFLLQPSNDGLKSGQWRTLHIPFSKLRNLQGDESASGQQAYFILLDTQVEARGLELQRIWVTRGPERTGNPR